MGTTYYIDWENGDDANDGITKDTPWQRAPGMRGCWVGDTGGNANAKRIAGGVAGDQFILKGGVTWPKEALSWDWYFGSGTEADPIYFGVDLTWYSGASWSRPILDVQGTETNMSPEGIVSMMRAYGNRHVIDNIEFTGVAQLHGGNNGYGATMLSHGTSSPSGGEIKNCYFHGWSHGPTTAGIWDSGVDAGQIAGDNSRVINTGTIGGEPDFDLKVHHNVIDGSDTTGDMIQAYRGSAGHFYNNYIGYTSNGIITVNLGYVWGNTFDHIAVNDTNKTCPGYPDGYFSFCCSMHGNGIETYGTQYPIYNNLFSSIGGGSNLILYPTALDTTYIFNNVIYNDTNCTMQLGAQSMTEDNIAGYYIFNNTIQNSFYGCTISGPAQTYEFSFSTIQNNHVIGSPYLDDSLIAMVATTLIVIPNIEHTPEEATSAGYASSGTYPYLPPAGGVTVGAGTNLQSIAAGIPSTIISDAATAALSDTSCGVEYDAINHIIIGQKRTPIVRGSVWDIGAYEYETPSVACENVICDDICDGTTRYYNGICDPETGECLYAFEENSIDCGYIPPDEPIEETPIMTYVMIGGIGLTLLSILSKK